MTGGVKISHLLFSFYNSLALKRNSCPVSGASFFHKKSYSATTFKIENQFGFEKITSERKQEKVDDVFKSVADKYDIMNDAMSLGIHRVWKDIFVDRLSPTPGTKLLDVAGGTGDISFRFLRYVGKAKPESSVTVCDINPKMLEVGKRRLENLKYCKDQIEWVEGNAEKLPFGDETYDAYTIAFGIRNVTHVKKVLEEAYRVLKPGGRFMCLEFSQVSDEYLRWAYDQYSFQVIPVLGELIAGDWRAYQYLVESIRNFPTQEDFKELICKAGFRIVTYENLTFGLYKRHCRLLPGTLQAELIEWRPEAFRGDILKVGLNSSRWMQAALPPAPKHQNKT